MKVAHLRIRRQLLCIGVTSMLALPLAAGFATASATATTTTGIPAPYISTGNSSDADIETCFDGSQWGLCAFTSKDLGNNGQGADNSYPMFDTLGYFSTDGGKNWSPRGTEDASQNKVDSGTTGVVANEAQYVAAGWVNQGTNHQWAPSLGQGPDGSWYLYVPNVSGYTSSNPTVTHTNSFIGVLKSTSNSAFGPFVPVSGGQIRGASNVHSGYASDPDILVEESGNRDLVYANGDWPGVKNSSGQTSCGGISFATMNSSMSAISGSSSQIVINGFPSYLGNCTASGDAVQHPYEEGPSLYWTPGTMSALSNEGIGPYLLVVPVKPTSTPPGCSTTFGEPGTNNSVMTYATSNNPQGPFTYGGILMCGSQKEWTDHGSLVMMPTPDGGNALILVYQDDTPGSSGPHNRKLHAECLMYGPGYIAAGMRTAGTTFSQSGAVADCLANNPDRNAVALLAPNGQIVSTQINQSGFTNGELTANRMAVGPQEKYHLGNATTTLPGTYARDNSVGGGIYYGIFALTNSRWVTASGSTPLTANSTSYGAAQQYNTVFSTGGVMGTVYFGPASGTGKDVNLQNANGSPLIANVNSSALFKVLHY